ncbi:MAG: helix-turn-helix domain-containing protein [Burkholderiaceae bacterium]|nr:helix-turn-helix domain-containing protein [Burkholderiaceae bacterium]
MEQAREFTLDELCALTDLGKRTVRYYVQMGLVDRPHGETRAARYGARHLEQLLQIRRWVQEGMSLERIRALLDGEHTSVPLRARPAGTVEVWSHLVLADGVELQVEPGRAGLSPEQLRQFYAGVMAVYASIQSTQDEQ